MNLRLAQLGAELGGDTQEFLCECNGADCLERLVLTEAEFGNIASRETRFVVCLGHVDPALDRVVDAQPGYFVVEAVPALDGEPSPDNLEDVLVESRDRPPRIWSVGP